MKVTISKDEWYPVFVARIWSEGNYGATCEIPDDVYERFRKAEEEFDEAMIPIREAWKQATGK